MIELIATGIQFDGTITLGSIIWGVTSLTLATIAWADMRWRVKNLETWRLEHMLDADARDKILHKLEVVSGRLEFIIHQMNNRRSRIKDWEDKSV